ncbi:uncharacterized protein LOC119719099 [Patiria miniata]|uniref:Fibronectin type-III domain-containing protein n=1 Tax=Patiria miniata TaxID=46514 RepID=A0A913YX56_PATMI|nr:uncharacterized protein LOC119719096 [Patiria miniata]XP_038044342.1 uncharacterized protein LOC119719099 [Patiria miniata]
MTDQGVLELAALGRPMQLGMLYDCRTDRLIPGMTLWDQHVLQKDRDEQPQPSTEFDIMLSDRVDDKASSLNIDASLKASFLGGLVDVQGSANFLYDNKPSHKQARLTLHYKTTTKFEQLTMKHLGVHNVQHPDVFDQGTATHVVTGILYGAQAFFVFDRDCESEENIEDVQGQMYGMVKRLASLEIDGEGSLKTSEREAIDEMRCRFHGDFIIENNASSYEEAVRIYKNLPSMIGNDGENAVQVRVWLYPLAKLDKKAAKLAHQISINFISQCQGILEGLGDLEVKCNDLIRTQVCIDFPQFQEKFAALKKRILEYKLSLEEYLARALPAIRGGSIEEQALADFLGDSVQSPFGLEQLNSWIVSREKEMNVVEAYMNNLFAGIPIIKTRADLEKLVLDPLMQNVVCFTFPLQRQESYLEVLSQYLKSPNVSAPAQDNHSCCFFDKSASVKMRLGARNFAEFYHATTDAGSYETAYAVTGVGDEGSSWAPIMLYEEGNLTPKVFEPPSKPGKPLVKSKTHEEICLEWLPPKMGISEVQHYNVQYRKSEPGSQWQKSCTKKADEELTIQNLQPLTSYQFQVVAVCPVGVSQAGEISDPCTTLPVGPPAKVRKHAVSHTCVTIAWEPPAVRAKDVQIERYSVKYNQVKGGSIAKPHQEVAKSTSGDSCLVTIDDLKTNESYRIWVSAECGSAGNGTESEPLEIATDQVHRPVRYTRKIAENAEILTKGCESTGTPTILKVPLNRQSVSAGRKYRSYSFGKRFGMAQQHKVIMVVGATGAGKSTLINGMINYILKVQWDDGFRFKIIDQQGEGAQSQAHSQTQNISSYTIYGNKHHNIPYTLTIIDTPGFGDTRGIERDIAIVDQIRNFFSHSEAHKVDHIDAIGFVAQSSLARLTHTQRYVFDSILSVFGKDISPNILLLVTFCDGQKPPVIDAIKEADIPCSDSMFKFNNSALFASNEDQKQGGRACRDTDDEDNFDKMFWRMGMRSMCNFFCALNSLESRSLSLTKEVLQERKRLETAVEGLQPQIQMGVCKLEELRNEQQILEQHETEIQANKSFEYEVEVPKSRMVKISDYITNCSKCHFSCHHPCGIANDSDKSGCWAMESNGQCRICPGKCIWNVHFNQAYKFEYYSENEKRTYAELEERYKDATGKKLTVEQVIKKHFEEFLSVQKCVFVLITDSHQSLKRLEEIALKPNPLSTVEYVDLLIESERTEAKPGWKSRVKALQDVRKQADILTKVKKANYDPFENYKKELSGKKGNTYWYQFWK